jgi:hypothetical protein
MDGENAADAATKHWRHGIEIDGIGYIPEPPKWLAEAMADQHKQSAADVIKLRGGRSGETAT